MTDINFIKKISSLNNNIQPNYNVQKNDDNSFKELLNEILDKEVSFSKHANECIKDMNIDVFLDVS